MIGGTNVVYHHSTVLFIPNVLLNASLHLHLFLFLFNFVYVSLFHCPLLFLPILLLEVSLRLPLSLSLQLCLSSFYSPISFLSPSFTLPSTFLFLFLFNSAYHHSTALLFIPVIFLYTALHLSVFLFPFTLTHHHSSVLLIPIIFLHLFPSLHFCIL